MFEFYLKFVSMCDSHRHFGHLKKILNWFFEDHPSVYMVLKGMFELFLTCFCYEVKSIWKLYFFQRNSYKLFGHFGVYLSY